MAVAERPYWWDTVARSDTLQRSGALPPRADVAIVGAGYTGLAAALTLRSTGATVVVLEREQVGAGASSRNAGQVLTGLKIEPAALVQRFGAHRARELFEVSIDAIDRLEQLIAAEHIDCEYVRSGHLQAAAKPSHFDGFRQEQALLERVFHHRVELVSASEQHNEIGTGRYHGLLLDERSAALNPATYVHGLARAAAESGAEIFTGTEVTAIGRLGNGWRISTNRGDVETTEVLVATNAYATNVTPALQRRLLPVGSYIIVTAPLERSLAARLLPRRRMAFDSKHFLYYFRLTADDRLLFGGRAEFGRVTPDRTRRAAAILRRGMAEIFPELASVAVEYAWAGKVAFTRDQLPHAGRLDGFWFAGGYGGHGIAMATLLGTLIGARIAGEAVAHPLLDLPCPPIPFLRDRPWFLPVVGAYYRVKDWLD